MITSSGAVCDICGNYIFPGIDDEMVHNFRVKGIDSNLCCDNVCKDALDRALVKKDWKELPEGPLRKAFSEALSILEREFRA